LPINFLLDTNIASYVIKGTFPRVRDRLMRVPMRDVGISVITEAELRFGVARLPRAAKLGLIVEEFLKRLEAVAWDSSAAQYYARLRAALEANGEPMGQHGSHDCGSSIGGGRNPGNSRSRFPKGEGFENRGLEQTLTLSKRSQNQSRRLSPTALKRILDAVAF